MRKTLKASMTAIMLSSVALVPMATIATVATTDAAFAKSENAGGKGNGNGKSNGGQSKAQERSGGQSGSKSASSRGKGGGLGGFFDKLTGRDKATTRSASASAKPAKGSGMHPSELGNMNGALNANINAVLAHIRNGNTNGPVGHLAALAVAADGVGDAEDIIAREAVYQMLDQALVDALDDAGYIGDSALDDYDAAVVDDPEMENSDVEEAISSLADAEANRPTEEEVADATDAFAAVDEAEADILDYWNKNPGVPEIVIEGEPTPQEVLLDKLYERLEGNEEAIADAIGEPEMDEEIGGDVADCEGAEDCSDDDDIAELIE